MSSGSWKILIFRGTVTVVSLILTLLLCEYYLRSEITHIVKKELAAQGGLVEANPEFLVQDTARGRRFVPNAHVVIKNHYLSKQDVQIDINSLGFRGAEIGPEKSSNERRIVFLGDSVTISDYLPENETFPFLVGQSLQSAHPEKKVVSINAAIGNIGTEEEVNILEDSAAATKPDLVVLGFYLNDSRPPWGFSGEIGDRGWLRRHSVLAETVYEQLEQRRWIEKQGVDRFAWIEKSLRLDWRNNPEALKELAGDARYDWGAAWQPSSWAVVEKELSRLKTQTQRIGAPVLLVAFPVIYQVEAQYLEDGPQRELRNLASKLGFTFLDLLPQLRAASQKKIFYDHCHLTKMGNAIVAEAIANNIRDEGLVR